MQEYTIKIKAEKFDPLTTKNDKITSFKMGANYTKYFLDRKSISKGDYIVYLNNGAIEVWEEDFFENLLDD